MPRIRCHYLDCIFLDERYCSAAAIEVNPDAGCLTYSPNEEDHAGSSWEDEELDDWDEMGGEDDHEDLWEVEDDEDDDDDLSGEKEDYQIRPIDSAVFPREMELVWKT